MDEITFEVRVSDDSGWLIATWDAPQGAGGITTQGRDPRELQDQVRDAIQCHFDPGEAPRRVRLHFVSDPVLVQP